MAGPPGDNLTAAQWQAKAAKSSRVAGHSKMKRQFPKTDEPCSRESLLSVRAAIRPAAGLSRFLRSDEGAHELARNLGRDCVHIDALTSQKLPRVFDLVHAGRFDLDVLEPRRSELACVFVIL